MTMRFRGRLSHTCRLPQSSRERGKRVNPLLLFIVVYGGYNLIGLMNTPWIISGAYDKTVCWELFSIGLCGFLAAVFISGKCQSKRREISRRKRTSIQLTILFILIFLTCLMSAIVLSGGVPLFLGEERFGNSALAFNLAQLYGFWVLVRIISDCEENKKIRFLQPVIYILGVLCFGYRTPILIFLFVVLTYLIVFRFERRKAFFWGVTSVVFIIAFAAIFSAYRVSQNYDLINFFKNINFLYVDEHKYLLPFVPALAMFDFSQNTVSTIGSALHDYMYGQLFLSNYETFLPGKHWGARNIIGAITSARWVAGRPMSITPTLQGALYVDFGYLGVFFGFFVIAVCINYFWKQAKNWGALGKFGFCYLLTLSIMAVHNGYWDVGFVFFILFLIIIKIFDALKGVRPQSTG